MSRIPQKDVNNFFTFLRKILNQLGCIKDAIIELANNSVPPTGDSCDNPTYVKLCDAPVDFEYKTIGNPICYECPDGTKYQIQLCVKYEDGVEVGTETIVIGPDGKVLNELPDCAVPCVEEPCSPSTINFLGNEAPADSVFHEFSFRIPSCCGVKVTTSAGEYIFDSLNEIRYVCEEYHCTVSDFTIEALTSDDNDCVSKIRTQLTKKS